MLSVLAFLALASVLGAADAARAQGRPQAAPWIQLAIVQVDPTMVDEYAAVQRELAARVKRAGTPWRSVCRTDVFGDSYRFLIATPLQSLASLDARQDAELAALGSRAQRYVKNQQVFALRTIPELDNPLPDKQQPSLIVVNLVKIVPGREQDYFELMKSEFLPHFDKAGFHHTSGALAFGGDASYIHLFYVRDFAKLDEGSPVMKALGPKGAQGVTGKLSGIVTSSEMWIARLVPEASYGAWTAAPAKP